MKTRHPEFISVPNLIRDQVRDGQVRNQGAIAKATVAQKLHQGERTKNAVFFFVLELLVLFFQEKRTKKLFNEKRTKK